MAKLNPEASKLIDSYIENLPSFAKEICSLLRILIHQANSGVKEDWKWKIPVFHKNYMVCGFAAFKKHVSLTFFQGAIMKDDYGLFSKDCSAQKTRTIKISTISEIDEAKLLAYFVEAFELKLPQRKQTSAQKKELVIPMPLKEALDKNEKARENFNAMAYTYRKEYAHHISDAKRESTKLKRLKKVIANLEQNIKMHEQYKC